MPLDARADAPADEIVRDLAERLVTDRMDPSDPDTALEFLLDLEVYRPTVVCKHFDAALTEAGQIYIARDISRREAA
ncbi:hypothetical protein V1291_000010 [Nitrobacteraceae bacterium AZCC 1564]